MATRRIKLITAASISYLSFYIVRGLEHQVEDPFENTSFDSLYTQIFNWGNDKTCPTIDVEGHGIQDLGHLHPESDIHTHQGKHEHIYGEEIGSKLQFQYNYLQDKSSMHTTLWNTNQDPVHHINNHHRIEESDPVTNRMSQVRIQGAPLAEMTINKEPHTWYQHHPSINNPYTAPFHFSHTPEDTDTGHNPSANSLNPSHIYPSLPFPLNVDLVDDLSSIPTCTNGNDIFQGLEEHQKQTSLNTIPMYPHENPETFPNQQLLDHMMKFSHSSDPEFNFMEEETPEGAFKFSSDTITSHNYNIIDSSSGHNHRGIAGNSFSSSLLVNLQRQCFPRMENALEENKMPRGISIHSDSVADIPEIGGGERSAHTGVDGSMSDYTSLNSNEREKPTMSTELWNMKTNLDLSFPNDKMPHHLIRNILRRIPGSLRELGSTQLRMYGDLVSINDKWFLDWKKRFKVSVENLDFTGGVLTDMRKNLEHAGRKVNSAVVMVFLGFIAFVDAPENPESDCYNLFKKSLHWIQGYIDGFSIFDTQKIQDIIGSETDIKRYNRISPFRVLHELLFLKSPRDFKLYVYYQVWKEWRDEKVLSLSIIPYGLLNTKLRIWMHKGCGRDQSYVDRNEAYLPTTSVTPKLSEIATSRQTLLNQGRSCVRFILNIEQELRVYFKQLRSSLLTKVSDKKPSLGPSEIKYYISRVENAISNLKLRLVPSLFGVVKIVLEKETGSSEFLHIILRDVWDFLQIQFSILTKVDFDTLFVGSAKMSHASSNICQESQYMMEIFKKNSSVLKIIKVEPTIWDLLKRWPKPSSIKDHVRHLDEVLETCIPEQFPLWLKENGFNLSKQEMEA
ncbi:uncharacterized protein MELLADRAFT_62237 [Melampsora larici-populina 98AG31]|uniref:Uncharacterized protein n=1 Tax=Melampsora larici-populina (strain 98AG31 / pathotype 3-4-7) TaxID=747676 RepID=F4RI39_MELLP|nr:uncharacterized protein MELLADRAFT_62237 [Melampsora larici-populina 98AG31]EGG08026.1 hypothetical protein MELLADRAFT_62237 [Melampsora larici-populina 98AG31]